MSQINRWTTDSARSRPIAEGNDSFLISACSAQSSQQSRDENRFVNTVPRFYVEGSLKAVQSLGDSLRLAGCINVSDDDLSDCPEVVISAFWTILADFRHVDRQLRDERDKFARILSDNKLLKSKLGRLQDEIDRMRLESTSQELGFKRREEALLAKMDDLGRNRSEWEKAALTYKGRERKFVAEMRKQETAMVRIQDKMRRSVSVVASRRSPVVIEDKLSPPPPLERSSFIRKSQIHNR